MENFWKLMTTLNSKHKYGCIQSALNYLHLKYSIHDLTFRKKFVVDNTMNIKKDQHYLIDFMSFFGFGFFTFPFFGLRFRLDVVLNGDSSPMSVNKHNSFINKL